MRQRIVKPQKTGVIFREKYKNSSGDGNSPYWNWINNHNIVKYKNNAEWEPSQANPDMLSDLKSSDPSLILEQREKVTQINNLMTKLSFKEHQVIWLLIEGKTQLETAAELRISRSAVRVYLNRAKKKLKGVTNFL